MDFEINPHESCSGSSSETNECMRLHEWQIPSCVTKDRLVFFSFTHFFFYFVVEFFFFFFIILSEAFQGIKMCNTWSAKPIQRRLQMKGIVYVYCAWITTSGYVERRKKKELLETNTFQQKLRKEDLGVYEKGRQRYFIYLWYAYNLLQCCFFSLSFRCLF